METERLFLRELEPNDSTGLSGILCDRESMKYYPNAFSEEQVENWIDWNIKNYGIYNHGLWAVILKEGNTFIGDCGVTIQEIDGEKLPELGYHINKKYCNKGYATEAASACIVYAFETLGYDELFAYMKRDNVQSIRVAEKIGMKFVKYFTKIVMGIQVEEALYRLNK